MTTIIHSKGFPLTSEARAHLMRRFTFALHRFEDKITMTEVYFKDLNGAGKGGEDKSVLVKIRLRGRPPVVVETVSHDLYIAISVAAKRCKRAVRRNLKFSRRIRHMGLRQVPT
jgi:ribosome-associated translation inhibitor RaiA